MLSCLVPIRYKKVATHATFFLPYGYNFPKTGRDLFSQLPPPMHPGTPLDHDGLRDTAKRALGEAGRTLKQSAEELGVSFGAVGRATRESGPKLAALQRQIIERYTPFTVEESTTFRLVRKGKTRSPTPLADA